MARIDKNTLKQTVSGLALYLALLRLILILRYGIIKIQIFGPIFRISPNCLTNRPLVVTLFFKGIVCNIPNVPIDGHSQAT